MVTRVPRELGSPWQFLEEFRHGSNRTTNSRMIRRSLRLGPSGDELQALRGIAKRRKRSAVKRLSGSRSAP
jgi:hypothetical protein